MKFTKRQKVTVVCVVLLTWLLTLGVHISRTTQISKDHYPQRSADRSELYFQFVIRSDHRHVGIPFLLSYSYDSEPFSFEIYGEIEGDSVDRIIIENASFKSKLSSIPRNIIKDTTCKTEIRKRYGAEGFTEYHAFWLTAPNEIVFTPNATVEISYRVIYTNGTSKPFLMTRKIEMSKKLDISTYWAGIASSSAA